MYRPRQKCKGACSSQTRDSSSTVTTGKLWHEKGHSREMGEVTLEWPGTRLETELFLWKGRIMYYCFLLLDTFKHDF